MQFLHLVLEIMAAIPASLVQIQTQAMLTLRLPAMFGYLTPEANTICLELAAEWEIRDRFLYKKLKMQDTRHAANVPNILSKAYTKYGSSAGNTAAAMQSVY